MVAFRRVGLLSLRNLSRPAGRIGGVEADDLPAETGTNRRGNTHVNSDDGARGRRAIMAVSIVGVTLTALPVAGVSATAPPDPPDGTESAAETSTTTTEVVVPSTDVPPTTVEAPPTTTIVESVPSTTEPPTDATEVTAPVVDEPTSTAVTAPSTSIDAVLEPPAVESPAPSTTTTTTTTTVSDVAAAGGADALAVEAVGSVAGTVSGSDGSAAEGVRVELYDESFGLVRSATANASGAFVLAGVPAGGPYRLYAWDPHGRYADEYWENTQDSSQATLITVGEGTATSVAMVLSSSSVAGTVRDAAGAPLSGITVWLSGDNGSWSVSTDGSGRYHIAPVVPGTYTLQFSDGSRTYQSEYWDDAGDLGSATPITIGDGDVRVLDAVLAATAPGSVAGTVTGGDGGAATGVRVDLYDESSGFTRSTTTGVDGAFVFASVPAGGPYRLSFFDPLGRYAGEYWENTQNYWEATPIEMTDGGTVSIAAVLSSSSVAGTVTDAAGAPLSGIYVYLSGDNGSWSGYTDGSGRYSIAPVVPGTYTLQFVDGWRTYRSEYWDDAGDLGSATPITIGDADVQVLDAVLAATAHGSVAGTVAGSDGSAAAGIAVDLYDESSGYTRSTTTGVDGAFVFASVPVGGPYRLSFFDPQGRYAGEYWQDTQNYWEATPIEMTDGGTVSIAAVLSSSSVAGTVTDAAGAPLSGIYVSLSGDNGSWSAYTDGSGRYHIAPVVPGTYTLQFVDGSRTHRSEYWDNAGDLGSATPITIGDGDVRVLDAALAATAHGSVAGTVTGPDDSVAEGIVVELYDESSGYGRSTTTGADGAFVFASVPVGGPYRLSFWDPHGRYAFEYWQDTQNWFEATRIEMTDGGTVSIAAELDRTLSTLLSGVVSDVAGNPLAGITVVVEGLDGSWYTSADSNSAGGYYIVGVEPGTYRLRFFDSDGSHRSEWWNDAATAGAATAIAVTDGATLTFDAALSPVAQETAPSVPLGLSTSVAPASGVGSGEVRLSWSAPASNGGSSVTDYVIERSTNGTTWVTIVDGVSTSTSYLAIGLSNGTAYQFRVSARNAIGDGPATAPVTATPRAVPGAPLGLAAVVAPASGVGSGEVRLSWAVPASDGGSPVTDYVIERSTNGFTWVTVVDGVSTATSHTVSGLSNGTAYQFRVTARNAVGDGQPSAEVSATPRTLPSVPLALSAAVAPVSGVGSGEVRLSWAVPASDGGSPVTDYVIEQSTNGTTWVTVVDGVSTTSNFKVTGLTNGTTYQFRVSARNAVGDGPSSVAVSATPRTVPGAPSSLVAAVAPVSASVRVRFA